MLSQVTQEGKSKRKSKRKSKKKRIAECGAPNHATASREDMATRWLAPSPFARAT
jgi:hypothetical protein